MICNGQSAKQLIDYGDATLADSDGIDDGHLLFNKNYNYPCKIILVGGKGYPGFTLTPSAGQSHAASNGEKQIWEAPVQKSCNAALPNLQKLYTWSRWGTEGEPGQSKLQPCPDENAAIKVFGGRKDCCSLLYCLLTLLLMLCLQHLTLCK